MKLGGALAIVLTAGWIPMFWFRVERFKTARPFYSGAERTWTWLAPTLLGAHVSATCITLNLVAVSALPAALTLAIFVAAVGFWFWGRIQIGPLGRTRLPDEPPQTLRRDGAFGIVRHPTYSAYLLAAGAPLIAAPSWWLALSYLACILAIAMRAAQEERRLHQQLGGAYSAYCREVRRLVPGIW